MTALHAGPRAEAVAEALGHGADRLVHVTLPEGADPADALVSALADMRPDVILTGMRGDGGEDAGLLPYVLARRLGASVVTGAVAIARGPDGTLVVEQALGRGVRRRLTLRLPAVVAVSPAAPPPSAYAHGARRRGVIDTIEGVAGDGITGTAGAPGPSPEERPYRKRPKVIARAGAAPRPPTG
ncbi:hypothetical protein [Methylobrevis pamukkalensis]|uniref:hypothetical protein n=1 Tax=Methylobrevis pamukkalensis TaxID=1439726 RepID=UPI001FD9C273|nr:hypothetical protein [Methylobrevis pamukkalensis]